MRSVAVTCVKNEIDLIEAFVRHTLALVDHLVVLDNGSRDGTCDVLRTLEKEGLPLEIVEDPSPGKYQSQRMTRLMREAAVDRHQADWVLPLDADEFLAIPPGAAVIPAEADAARPLSLPWRTYVPAADDDPAELNPVLRIRRRRVAEGWEPAKVMVPRSLAALPDATLAQGSHEILVGGRPREPCPHGGGHLAHFPLRTPGQYAAKIAVGSLQYQVVADRNWQWGYHYKEPFALLKRDLPAFLAGFSQAALRYATPAEARIAPETVLEPLLYRGGPLRYTPRVDDATVAWQALLGYAEDLAGHYAVLAAGLSDGQRLAAKQQAVLVASLHEQLEGQRQHIAYVAAEMARWWQEWEAERRERDAERQEEQQRRQEAETAAARTTALLEEARAEIAALRQSWTWRIGRLVVGPAAWAKQSRRHIEGLAHLHPPTGQRRAA